MCTSLTKGRLEIIVDTQYPGSARKSKWHCRPIKDGRPRLPNDSLQRWAGTSDFRNKTYIK
jgi:hypothetical protein